MTDHPRGPRRSIGLGAVVAGWAAVTIGQTAAGRLTGSEALARAYDDILNAGFDRADAELTRACGPAPPEACQVLGAAALWWRISLDPASTAFDVVFEGRVSTAIQAVEAWVAREPDRAESWFYLGGAYAVRAQWRVLRSQHLAAARDGKRIKIALERAITLDPALNDAYFGLGLYKYYADVAPTALKILRWLLLLPGGDRREGLSEMLRARERGELLRGEADYQLHIIYLWYEQQPVKALGLLQGLRTRYPGNPIFLQKIAEVQDQYLHDLAASLDSYRALFEAARQRRLNFPELAEVHARLGMARQLDALCDTDRAIEHLNAIVDTRPQAPYGAQALAHFQLGAAYDRIGRRDLALDAYRAALAATPPADPYRVRDRARIGIRVKPDVRSAEAYRLSLEGWRDFERRALEHAEAALKKSLSLKPTDPVTHYRYGRLLDERQDSARALAEFESVIRARPPAPPTILAAAYLEAGRLLERAGQEPRALQMYSSAASVHGSAAETRAAATRSIARLRSRSAVP